MELSKLVIHKDYGLCYTYCTDYGRTVFGLLTTMEAPDGIEKLSLKHKNAFNYLADKIKFK